MIPYTAQSITVEPETIQAFSELGVAAIALVVLGVVLWQAFKALNKSIDRGNDIAKALDRVADKLATSSAHDEALREKTNATFDRATENLAKIGMAFDKFKSLVDERLEDQSDALRGKDGVLIHLKTSLEQIADLNVKTKAVVDSAKSISDNLEAIKEGVGKMNVSDDEVKRRIETIQNQLTELSSAVSSIPSAVGDAEKNIIAAFEKRGDTRPVPPLSVKVMVVSYYSDNAYLIACNGVQCCCDRKSL